MLMSIFHIMHASGPGGLMAPGWLQGASPPGR